MREDSVTGTAWSFISCYTWVGSPRPTGRPRRTQVTARTPHSAGRPPGDEALLEAGSAGRASARAPTCRPTSESTLGRSPTVPRVREELQPDVAPVRPPAHSHLEKPFRAARVAASGLPAGAPTSTSTAGSTPARSPISALRRQGLHAEVPPAGPREDPHWREAHRCGLRQRFSCSSNLHTHQLVHTE